MAGGQIDGFFRRVRPGQPLRSLANIENLNKVANILNDITGEGCWLEKPLNGDPWIIHVSDDTSGEEPLVRRRRFDCRVDSVNGAAYDSSTGRIGPSNVSITVNGITVTAAPEWSEHLTWPATAGVKTLTVWQGHYLHSKDADGQYTTGPDYYYSCSPHGGINMSSAVIAQIPWCRVEVPVVGEPPVIHNLLEGPVHLYCYRGDNKRCYAPYIPLAVENALKPTSITTQGYDNLPVKVRNIDGGTDGYYNAYPNGRYHIVTSQGVDEVEWYTPHEPEQTKNDAKLLLLRYLWPQNNVPHGLPYWQTVAQFLTNTESWTEDYITDQLGDDDKSWLISLLSPWAWDVWSEYPGPYEPVLESDIEEGVEVLAAVKDSNGDWVSVFDVVASQEDLDVALGDYDDLYDRVGEVEGDATNGTQVGDDAKQIADDADQTIANFTDYSSDVTNLDWEKNDKSGHVASLTADFAALDARISALEHAV